jgi:hypothetical protein
VISGYCEFVFDLITDFLDLRGVISVVAAVAAAVLLKRGGTPAATN